MFNICGRIVSRGDNIAGLFLPIADGLPLGVYELREVLGEFMLVRIGEPAMPPVRLIALNLEQLHDERAMAAMTQEELARTTEWGPYMKCARTRVTT